MINLNPSLTFNEFLLESGLTKKEHKPENILLRTPLVKFEKGKESDIYLNTPCDCQ